MTSVRARAPSRVARVRARTRDGRVGRASARATRSRAVSAPNDAAADVESAARALSRALETIGDADVNVVVVERDDVRRRMGRASSLLKTLGDSAAFERAVTFRKAPTTVETAKALRLTDDATTLGARDEDGEALASDIATCVRAFVNVVPGDEEGVRVTLSLLRSTLCSRLHVDHTSARMMVTFYGRGTEICDAKMSAAIAKANAEGGNFVTDVLKTFAEKFSPPREVGACDVALLKGERWTYPDGSTSKGKAIVHRSPLIDEDEWRLTLKVDVANFGCECGEKH
jgi:hypothetical protein